MKKKTKEVNVVEVHLWTMVLGLAAVVFLVVMLATASKWGPWVDGEPQVTQDCGHSQLPLVFMVDPRELVEGKIILMQMRTAPGPQGPGQGTAWLLGVGDHVEAEDFCGQDLIHIYVGESDFSVDSLPPPVDPRLRG